MILLEQVHPCSDNNASVRDAEDQLCMNTITNLVQESTFCAITIRSTFYPNPISLKMISRKFHASSSMAYLHKCRLNYTLPYGRSNFQSDFFAILIANSDSLRKTAWRNYLSFSNIPKGSGSNKTKTKKIEGKLG